MGRKQEVDIPGVEKMVCDGTYQGMTLYFGDNFGPKLLAEIEKLNEEIRLLRIATEALKGK